MILLIILLVATLVARGLGAWKVPALNSWPAAVRAGLAVMFLVTAKAHFDDTRDELINMVPLWMPNAAFMVSFTGVCEILGAIGILLPPTRRVAALGLVIFLIGVFPANVYAAQNNVLLRGEYVTPIFPRLIIQLLFIGLVWWSGIHRARS